MGMAKEERSTSCFVVIILPLGGPFGTAFEFLFEKKWFCSSFEGGLFIHWLIYQRFVDDNEDACYSYTRITVRGQSAGFCPVAMPLFWYLHRATAPVYPWDYSWTRYEASSSSIVRRIYFYSGLSTLTVYRNFSIRSWCEESVLHRCFLLTFHTEGLCDDIRVITALWLQGNLSLDKL